MKKILALILALVMALSLVACGSDAPADDGADATDDTVYTLKLSTTRGENTWFAKMYNDMAAELEEASGGRLKLEIFHNNTLGAPADIWTLFTSGGIDMLDMSPGMVGSFTVSEIFNVPFMFDNDQQVGDMMWELYNAGLLKEYTDNMKVLMFLPAGALELCTVDTKVESMDDLKGLILRGSSATINKGIVALGGSSASIQPSEQTMALSQGLLDGVITGANFAEIQSLYESCKYLMNYNIGMSCMFLGINNASYEKLPADLQELLTTTCSKWYTEYYMSTLTTEYGQVLDRLENQHGMEIYQPSEELIADMKAATASLLDEYVANLTAAGLDADAVMAIVNKYVG